MKRTNRQKNSIVVGFILSISIFILSVFYILYNIIPTISNIEDKKTSTAVMQSDIKTLKNKGLSYSEFKNSKIKLNLKGKGEKYLKQLILNTDKDFYKKNFINTGKIPYKQFLKNKDIKIKQALKKSSLSLKNDIKKILPIYNDNSVSSNGKETLTDFKFINYLENLFKGFNIEYGGSLGINNIKNYYKGVGDLDTSIFYIPLEFSLKGKKKDIINFIHYFENVGNVSISKDGNKLNLYKDSFIKQNNIKDYNEYNNQISDIAYIKMPEYLDSSYMPRDNGTNLIDFIKKDSYQSNKVFSINIGIRFYTMGVKNYKIKEEILLILDNYKGLKKAISKELKNPKRIKSKVPKDILFINKLKKLNKTLENIGKNISLIRKKLNKKGNLNTLFQEALKYNNIIDRSSVIQGEKIYIKTKK